MILSRSRLEGIQDDLDKGLSVVMVTTMTATVRSSTLLMAVIAATVTTTDGSDMS